MKKIAFMLAMSALLLASCQKNDELSLVSENEVFTASVESFDAQTKTSMTQDRQVVWSSNDRIAIFQGSTIADEYKATDASAGNSNAIFDIVSDNSEVNGSFSAGVEVSRNIALYPYADNLSLEASTLDDEGSAYEIAGFVLPSTQNYASGSFGNGSFPMVAVTASISDHTLKFKNLLGAMKLQFKGTQTVKSIKVEGKNNEKLSGAATITAYATSLTPAITMAETAGTSVTLDCGYGVQLNESTATDFFIAIPPVLFSQGFIVTVTDDASQTYTFGADVANTVLRSSILTMPAITLTAADGGESDDDEDDATYIEYVFLSKSSLTMMPNTSYTLVADVDPVDVIYPTLTWSSSDNSVAEVDQSGKVTAKSDGNVTITALAAGGVSKSCSVTVKTPKTFAPGDYVDYVDELGVNHGKGVAVAGVIWAPVNCGYEAATADYKGYPYGKLYQWGRKYGQGYNENDATYPSGDNLIEGPVMPSWGRSKTYKDAVFYGSYNWCNTQIDDLWVDSEGNKTKEDPCPTGWRVPTYDELAVLGDNFSSWTTNSEGQNGYYFVGEYTYIDGLPQVFFPAAGLLNYYDGNANLRGHFGFYWSSRPYGDDAYSLGFGNGGADMGSNRRAYGFSVRCVQVIDEVAEL